MSVIPNNIKPANRIITIGFSYQAKRLCNLLQKKSGLFCNDVGFSRLHLRKFMGLKGHKQKERSCASEVVGRTNLVAQLNICCDVLAHILHGTKCFSG